MSLKDKFAFYSIYDKCSICLEKFKENDKISYLECGHVFHKTCMFLKIIDCPICHSNKVTPKNYTLVKMDIANLKMEAKLDEKEDSN